MAGVLVAGSDDLSIGFGEGGGVAACPWFLPVRAVVSGVDDVSVLLPNKVVGIARLCCALLLPGVCQSSRLLTEVGLLEFLLRLAEVLFAPIDGTLSFPLSPVFGRRLCRLLEGNLSRLGTPPRFPMSW